MNANFATILICSLLLAFAAAATGALFRPDAWYARLRKPIGLPPRWVFPVVWSLLYTLMAVAAARIFSASDSPERSLALALYGAQLLVNAAWSWLFFGCHRPLAALFDLGLLLLLISLSAMVFARVDTIAATLFIPYWLWLCTALYLNAAIWRLNRPTPHPAGHNT